MLALLLASLLKTKLKYLINCPGRLQCYVILLTKTKNETDVQNEDVLTLTDYQPGYILILCSYNLVSQLEPSYK